MEYFEILNLIREPFSNSPDPDLFYESARHRDCLQKLEIALRLRRGLNVVVGDVGTGKTTLCRQLIRKFSAEGAVETHLILDPLYETPLDFMIAVAEAFDGEPYTGRRTEAAVKEQVKGILYKKGVDQKKIVILVIDEGQKIPASCLEILREFLNFETNEHKLLQIVIFAQKEFEALTNAHANFTDRINLYHRLEPLDFRETCRMIQFRLQQSSDIPRSAGDVFSRPALWCLYRATGGYPRKIVNLCHRSILAMIVQNKSRVGWRLIRSCVKRGFPMRWQGYRRSRMAAAAAVSLVVLMLGGALYAYYSDDWQGRLPADILDGSKLPDFTRGPDSIDGPANREGPGAVHPGMSPEASRIHPAESVAQLAAAGVDDSQGVINHDLSPGDRTRLPTGTPHADRGKSVVADHALPEADAAEGNVPCDGPHCSPPEVLGRVAMARGESLWEMIRSVYGDYNHRKFKSIVQANPHIKNPDNVEIGQVIHFPAIAVRISSTDLKCWWINLGDKKKLTDAVQVMRQQPEGLPPARIIPHWHPETGLTFTVVLRLYLFEKEKALQMIEQLTAGPATDASLISAWGDPRTVFFADPYMT